jgi:FAD/FMN-containing dehydrogenase
MNRIVEPPDRRTGVTTLEPGVTQGELAELLEREDLPFIVPTTGAGPKASIVGNALEHGYGITPIADHFSAVVALEAVLPDGSLYRSPFSAMKASSNGLKWGVGPYVDGLFAQGGFGIVTKMTLALARRPESIKAFVFGVRTPSALDAAVLAVQRILATLPGIVGGINVMNAHRVLAMSAAYPADRVPPRGVMPQALVSELSARYDIMPWTVFGTLYGTRAVVAAAQREIKALLPATASRVLFVSARTAGWLDEVVGRIPVLRDRLSPRLATLRSSLALISGRPNQTALPLAYWKLRRADRELDLDPARDGCGLIWYAPIVPMTPEGVRSFVEHVEAVMPGAGFEPLVTLTSLSDRCFGSNVPVLFDMAVPEASDAAHGCYLRLLEEGAKRGFLPYRVAIGSMDWLMHQAPEHWAVVDRLKRAIDPQGLMAPGRYAPRRSPGA